MFYTVYKVTNLINNKTYIGKHKTKNLDDGYMGSGKLIKGAIKKYSRANFKKEILHVFDNEQQMNDKEKELVVLNKNSYNLCPGGQGGFGFINKNGLNIYGKNGQNGFGGENLINNYWNSISEEMKIEISKKISEKMKNNYIEKGSVWLGKKHTKESRNKMKQSQQGKQSGPKNSQFGTCWITNGSENKKIRKEELDFWIEKGYNKGRIIKPT